MSRSGRLQARLDSWWWVVCCRIGFSLSPQGNPFMLRVLGEYAWHKGCLPAGGAVCLARTTLTGVPGRWLTTR